MTVWRPLDPGEPIGVVALSGPIDPERLARGIDALRNWGHPVSPAINLGDRAGYLAGSDDARLAGLTDLLDRGVRFFLGARGGYGVSRLLDRVPWRRMQDAGVVVVGFSDLTALINPLAQRTLQVHGPMVAAGLARQENSERLRELVYARPQGQTLFRFASPSVLRHGRAEGVVVGGNLSVLSSLMGTPWEPDFNDRVLVLEEVSEPPYRLDRLLTQLRGSASFGGVKALICGTLHACRPHAECLARWTDLVLESTSDRVPVVVGLPFGHGARNLAFPIGATVEIDTRRGAVIWST